MTAPSLLSRIYQKRFSELEDYRVGVWRILIANFFQRMIPETATVLDIGAGHCEFINSLRAAKKLAIDANPDVINMAASDVQVLHQNADTPWPLEYGSVDVVFTSNFLEHLPDRETLFRCLKEAKRTLKPNGLFIAMGPNIRFCSDVYWDFIDHVVPLSDRSISEALTLSGFTVERVIPQFLPYTMVNYQPAPWMVGLYLSLPLLWPLFGKQFLITAFPR